MTVPVSCECGQRTTELDLFDANTPWFCSDACKSIYDTRASYLEEYYSTFAR